MTANSQTQRTQRGGALTREQFLFNETRTIARLRLQGASDEEIVERVVSENLLQYPTERMTGNITRVCLMRFDLLPSESLLDATGGSDLDPTGLLALIADGAPEAAKQANLYLMMRAYDLSASFMVDVVGRKYSDFDYSLTALDMNAFITDFQMRHEDAASWSDATVGKLKQVLRKCLVETGQLASARSDELVPIMIDPQVESAMRANGDVAMLPAFNCLEVW